PIREKQRKSGTNLQYMLLHNSKESYHEPVNPELGGCCGGAGRYWHGPSRSPRRTRRRSPRRTRWFPRRLPSPLPPRASRFPPRASPLPPRAPPLPPRASPLPPRASLRPLLRPGILLWLRLREPLSRPLLRCLRSRELLSRLLLSKLLLSR